MQLIQIGLPIGLGLRGRARHKCLSIGRVQGYDVVGISGQYAVSISHGQGAHAMHNVGLLPAAALLLCSRVHCHLALAYDRLAPMRHPHSTRPSRTAGRADHRVPVSV